MGDHEDAEPPARWLALGLALGLLGWLALGALAWELWTVTPWG